eukprot:CAMPEP_0172463324 /NCGR_PEP_ID=MMETSP1065-20121228/46814_1 /TAXON_ID=265537 /ORGANISM="Amphiprora paludosa, Strain CCMP125" /LENGTH=474 /DNA_ID=CAMNT_0013219241 /DNA_START=826 /DNA_END=2250 /DNA_ORIENTATION=-
MDVDSARAKFQQQQQQHSYGANSSNMKQDPAGRILDDRSRRSGSSRNSAMDRQPRNTSASSSQRPAHYASPPQAPPPPQSSYRASGGAPTGAAPISFGTPPAYSSSSKGHHHPQQHQASGHHHHSSALVPNSTPPDSAQPSYPPPAVTADSPQPSSDSQQRRPAYLLHRDLVIGKGSYGQVCIASRGESEGHAARSGKRKKFACKCVMLRNDPKYIAKLQEEVNVLRELRGHDNVIRLYDVFCVDNELFIITELGRGGDLFHLLTTHPKHGVTESYAAKTVVEMLSAVAFLHSRSICHRDLKLENWVLESGKDVWSPLKLIDFGLSTHFSRGQRLSRVVGSSYYVAPEVLKKSYTEACDLWSLGVIVYMLLSGAPPFYGKNDEAIKASIVQGEYTFPHELFRDVSDEAMAFVSTLLSYNIEYRYTADQALTHPWLSANCEPLALQKAKDGARGIGVLFSQVAGEAPRGGDPMQM